MKAATSLDRKPDRSKRRRAVRARTISVKRLPKRDLKLGALLYPEAHVEKPLTRGDCREGERPCPFVSCKHHLYLDVSVRTGAIKINFPDVDVLEMSESCVLDVADRESATLEEVGAIMNITRERIRQVELQALAKLRAREDGGVLLDFLEGTTNG